MLDFDAGKLLIIGLVALVVIGPKDLPSVLRQVGQAVGKLRRMAGEFQGQFMDAMKEADLQDLKSEIAKIKDSATLDVDFNPARDIKNQLTSAVNDGASPPAMAAPSDAPALAASPPEHLALLAPDELSPLPSIVGAGIGPVAEDVPGLEPEPLPAPAVHGAVGPDHDMLQAEVLRPDERDTERRTAGRKIVVTRRRRLSRLDGPTLRAAALTGRSRNILPARRDIKDQ